MAKLPVFKNGNPLWIDNGSGMVPAWAEDPCACCGFDFCECTCAEFVPQITLATLNLAGAIDWTCPNATCGGVDTFDYSALNGLYTVSGIVGGDGALDIGLVGNSAARGTQILTGQGSFGTGCLSYKGYLYQVVVDIDCFSGGTELEIAWALKGHVFRDSDNAHIANFLVAGFPAYGGSLSNNTLLAPDAQIIWATDCEGGTTDLTQTYTWRMKTTDSCTPGTAETATLTATILAPDAECPP